MVVLGDVEAGELLDLGGDGFGEIGLGGIVGGEGGGELFVGGGEDDAAVVGAEVGPDAGAIGRVVGLPKIIDEGAVGGAIGIEGDFDDLDVIGAAGADAVVGGVGLGAAGVTGDDVGDAGELFVDCFDAPEAAGAEDGGFGALGESGGKAEGGEEKAEAEATHVVRT